MRQVSDGLRIMRRLPKKNQRQKALQKPRLSLTPKKRTRICLTRRQRMPLLTTSRIKPLLYRVKKQLTPTRTNRERRMPAEILLREHLLLTTLPTNTRKKLLRQMTLCQWETSTLSLTEKAAPLISTALTETRFCPPGQEKTFYL